MKPVKLTPRTTVTLVLMSGLIGMSISACQPSNDYVPPPPPAVTVSQPIQREVTDYLEFTGNTQAVEHVEIRARVQGFLESVHFESATEVKKGDLLYVIDPRPFQAQVDKASADLSRKQAEYALAKENYQRIETLYKQNAAPRADFVQARAARDTALADIAAAKAVLEEAKLNLSYTEVRAPISGQVGRNLVSVGNLVGAGENTHLTTIVQYDPIWAYFSLNEHELLQLMRKDRENRAETQENQAEQDVIHLGLANEDGYPHEGRVDFYDQGVDPGTGTFLLRGTFANPQPHTILPGMFVRIRTPINQQQEALLIPERALGADQRGRYVLVVNAENVVEYRAVEVGASIGQMQVIKKGLTPDDWVVVKGLLRARPGATVDPQRQEKVSQLSGRASPSP